MREQKVPQIGQIVKVLRGREQGQYAIVIAIIDTKFVSVADGDKRKFDQPKKKNLLHLELQDVISSEVVNSLLESGRVTNGKLRYAINKFTHELESEAQEKGE